MKRYTNSTSAEIGNQAYKRLDSSLLGENVNMNENTEKLCSSIEFISNSLMEIISFNAENSSNCRKIKYQKHSCFYNKVVPDISLKDYLIRIACYTKSEVSTFIVMSLYIDYYCERNDFILTQNNIFRIIFSAAVVALKYNEDIVFSDYQYSIIGGISLSELITLESHFLNGMNYNLYIKSECFFFSYNYMKEKCNDYNALVPSNLVTTTHKLE